MKKFRLLIILVLNFYFHISLAAEIQTAALKTLVEKAKLSQSGVLLILQDNKTLAEENWDGPQTFYSLQSITKSILSLAYGPLIEQKKVSLDTKASKWIPEWKDNRADITIEQLMNNSAGFFEPENFALFLQSDMVSFAKKMQPKFLPGSTFSYSNASAILLGHFMKEMTGKDIDKNLKETLFAPLRIEKWSFDKDKSGNYITSGGLKLRSRDLLKIGNMLTHNGLWNEQKVIHPDWIKTITSPSRRNENYGLYWWLLYGNDLKAYYGQGYQGQYIVIIPAKKLVAIRLRSIIPDDQNKKQFDWDDFPKDILNLYKDI